MEKTEFKTLINAPREKVWDILWSDTGYPDWTSVFAEGSHAKTDWNKGSKVYFMDGKNTGMVSFIADKIPNEFMSFKHMGTIKDGVEDTNNEEAKEWAGATENYTLKEASNGTELVVEMDIAEQYKDYFLKTWPGAMARIKTLAEA